MDVHRKCSCVFCIYKEVALTETTEIWCALMEICEGEIWGKVNWCGHVLDGKSNIIKCLIVKM